MRAHGNKRGTRNVTSSDKIYEAIYLTYLYFFYYYHIILWILMSITAD